jgi:iron complex outermembrane receptor protein
VPGVDAVQNDVNDFNVNARGFNSSLARSVVVLQDGRDLAVPFLGSQEWAALSQPTDDLARVEFVRGPGSALYGANAFSGVIDITTPLARDVVGTKLTVGVGELNTIRADARHAGVVGSGQVGYRVNVGYSRSASWVESRTRYDGSDFAAEYAPATSDPVNPPPPGFELVPLSGQTKDPTTGSALGDADQLINIYGSARVDYYFDNGSLLTADGGAGHVRNGLFMTGIGRVQVIEAVRPWARLAFESNNLELSTWYSGRTALQPQVLLSSGLPIEDESGMFQVDGKYRRDFLADRGRVVLGASLRESKVNTKATLMDPETDDRSDSYYSLYGQLEFSVLSQLRIEGALRWDKSDLFESQFSPKGAVVFLPASGHAIRLTANRAFLTPSQIEFFLQINPAVQDLSALEAGLRASPLGPVLAGVPDGELFTTSSEVPVIAQGNPDLVPEKVTTLELGYKGQLGNVFVAVEGYYSRFNDFVTALLPAPAVNPAFDAWTSPDEVPQPYREPLEEAVQQALSGTTAEFGLTRLADGSTAIVLSYGNAGEVDAWGVEASASIPITHDFRLGGSYALFDSDIKDVQEGDVLLPNTPKHKGTASIVYTGSFGLDARADVRFVSAYDWSAGVFLGNIPSSETVNLSIGYQVNQAVRIFSLATNLLNQERFYLYGGSVNGRRLIAGATATF